MKPTPLPWSAVDTLVLGPRSELICDCAPDGPTGPKVVEQAKANAAFIAEAANIAGGLTRLIFPNVVFRETEPGPEIIALVQRALAAVK